jgi:CHAT domain-containing protein/Tfp pilus assembly protein PilF
MPRFRLVVTPPFVSTFLLVSSPSSTVVEKNEAPVGVVVEEVAKGSESEKAGIKSGDVLVSWVRSPAPPANRERAQGRFRDPFDVLTTRRGQSPRGSIEVSGTRDGASVSFHLNSDDWGIGARPMMPADILRSYLEGRALPKSDPPERAAAIWQSTAEKISSASPRLSCWLYLQAGDRLAGARLWKESEAAFDRAMQVSARAEPALIGEIWFRRGRELQAKQDWPAAESAFRAARESWSRAYGEDLVTAIAIGGLAEVARARGDLAASDSLDKESLAIRERLAPGSLPVAASLGNLGTNQFERGNLAEARTLQLRALAIRQQLRPSSSLEADSVEALGNIADIQGDLVEAESRHRRALEIRMGISPESLDVSNSLNNLGIILRKRGDLSAAEGYQRRALAIRENLAPGSMRLASSLGNLGRLAQARGDLAAADGYFRQTLAIAQRIAPGKKVVAGTLLNLGTVAQHRGDLGGAESFFTQALAIMEKLAPQSTETANILNGLGMVSMERGDFATADGYMKRSLAILEKTAPTGVDMAGRLSNFGLLRMTQGKSAEAADYYAKALDLQKSLGPKSLETAATLVSLGTLFLERSDLEAAEGYYRESLAIREKLASASSDEADSLYGLALVARARADRTAAAEYFRRAVEALDKQKGRLGGSAESRESFTAKYAHYYREYAEALLELNRRSDAFRVLERSRARSLLAMLAERDLIFSMDLPEKLERESKLSDADYDRTQDEIGQLSPQKDAQKIDELLVRMREIRTKQDDIAERIRKASPRLASLQYPQPLDAAGAQKALDPGTVLLAYSIGREKSFLFVVQPGPKASLAVVPLKLNENDLRDSVEALRNQIVLRPSDPGESGTGATKRSRSLYDALIKPAEKQIEKSERILILPDGPLHTLPFSALVRDVKAGKPQYLVEWKPLHTVVSATVYAELKKERRAAPASKGVVLAAFGDPKYPALREKKATSKRGEGETVPEEPVLEEEDQATDPEVRSAIRGGIRLDPLPASRQEVESIATLYAPRAVKYLGEEASEEKAKALGKDTPYIHFACHGILNERFPLDSALALTIPEKPKEGQDNGLLQAWEIFEKVRIDADLVTLSACETGLGKEMGGEGLVGLTRAFQYAGARSILASLWKVDDQSTAELMKRLYTYLKAGKTKDEALRLAQLDLIHSPSLAAPFHWAAFQLIGDWK